MPEPARNQTTLPPRLGLLLIGRLGAALATTPERRRRGQEGFSLMLVLIVALSVILGTLVIAGRANFGRQGSVFQMQSREARAAAELGATWAISEMNKVQNRSLLVTPGEDNETEPRPPGDVWPTIPPQNPCTDAGPSLAGLDPVTATPDQFEEWFILPNGSVQRAPPTDSSYRSFQIVGVARPSQNKLGIYVDRNFVDLDNSGTQPLVLRVEGRHYRNGDVVARTVLETEYEVVPKCCGRTFGGEHGNDVYSTVNMLGNDPVSGGPLEMSVCVPPVITPGNGDPPISNPSELLGIGAKLCSSNAIFCAPNNPLPPTNPSFINPTPPPPRINLFEQVARSTNRVRFVGN